MIVRDAVWIIHDFGWLRDLTPPQFYIFVALISTVLADPALIQSQS